MSKKYLLFVLFFYSTIICKAEHNGSLVINEIMASNVDCFFSPATNFDGWIEVRNLTNDDFPLTNCYISNDKNNLKQWHCPEDMSSVPANGYLVIWFDSNNINSHEPDFSLDVEGGCVYISDANGSLIVSQEYPEAIRRTSYARIDNGENWGTTMYPTPGFENGSSGFYTTQLAPPIVSQESQIFQNDLQISVDFPSSAILRYTTDGSTPLETNGLESFDGNLSIDETAILRFRLFEEGKIPSDVVTRSYIKHEYDFTLPIVSIVSDNKYLFDDSVGILVKGTNGIAGNGSDEPCNWNMEWERPAYFTYMEEKNLYDRDVMVEVSGHWSRLNDMKSLKLKGNKIFGGKTLDYPFFSDKPYIRNRTLVLRNGGQDAYHRIKDPALEMIMLRAGLDMDLQCYQPVMYYLNGKLKGVINMREPTNKHYVYANYGFDDDEIDMIEGPRGYIVHGDVIAYNNWCGLAEKSSDPDVYNEICQIVDIDEYLTYLASHIYLGVSDGWPKGNFKLFRPKDGRFRYLSYDADAAFNMVTLDRVLDINYYPDHKLPKETKCFVNMLKNKIFRRVLIDKICVMGGSVFNSSHAFPILDELSSRVKPMMALTNETPMPTIKIIKDSLMNRNKETIESMIRFEPLALKDTKKVHALIKSETKECQLFLNDIVIPYNEFDGTIFLPAQLKAVAPIGHKFIGWKLGSSSDIYSKEAVIQIPEHDFSITACFDPMSARERKARGIHPIMINEISAANDSYVNDYYKKTDWVELYNTTSEAIDVEGMWLSDNPEMPHKYRISKENSSASTIIPANGYLIIWCDKLSPKSMLHSSCKLYAD